MALLRASTTKSEWLPDDPTAFVPSMPWKSPFITTWDASRNQNHPTDSAEEAKNTLYAVSPPHRLNCSCRRHPDRKSTRLNSSHLGISYAVFCLKKKTLIACASNIMRDFAGRSGGARSHALA